LQNDEEDGMPKDPEFQRRLGSIDDLLRKIESAADPSLRADVQELVELIMSLHGAGLERILELIRSAGDPGEALIHKLGGDDLASSLMVLYGLHPLPFEARINQAVAKARTRLRPHGAELELISIQEGAVRLRLEGKSQGCGSQSLRELVEETFYLSAPDLTSLTIEGAEEKQSFVPLQMLQSSLPAPHAMNGKGGL
jgi:Fe-S cluster biogenesis protein NfuA